MRKSGTPDFRWHPRLHDIAAGKTWMAQQADLDGRNKSGHDAARQSGHDVACLGPASHPSCPGLSGKARTLIRHARPRAGHPRLHDIATSKTWMAGINPAMTLRVNPAMTLRVCARPLIRHGRACLARRELSSVMPGLVPGIHAFTTSQQARRGWPE